MKKLCFFLFSVVLMVSTSSCLNYSSLDDELENTDYFIRVNGNKVAGNDTAYVAMNDVVTIQMFDAKGQKVSAVYFSDNLTSAFATGTIADITYSATGVYRVTAKLPDGSKTISVYLSVLKSTNYILKINGNTVANGATLNFTTTQSLKFKVIDTDGKVVKTNFDFGDGNKITADSATIYYTNTGTYTMKAESSSKTITATIKVTKGTAESIVLINSSMAGNNINATLGFKCSLIPNFSASKTTYVVGATPSVSWNKYIVSDVVNIGGEDYLKWNVYFSPGKFRLSWIQQKNQNEAFNYDLCNWAYDTSSVFWNGTDYLFVFYIKVENGNIILSAN